MKELPKRKKLRLPQYDYSQPGYYFVTICTKEKRCLFGAVRADVPIGPHVALTPMGEIVDQTLSQMPTVDQYVVMPNHIHIIFHISESDDGPMGTSARTKNVSSLVRYFKRTVTRACGGEIWHRSFHDHVIRNQEDYLRICEYIENNPLKWTFDKYYTPSVFEEMID